MPRLAARLAAAVALVLSVNGMAAQTTTPIMPIEDVRPGMVGVGRTVFAGEALEEFKVSILGVLHNVMGPKRSLILARLEGGPLANTGVIQGMSGSPVYVDGKLVGAVSYSMGSFPKEPLAGITPIDEMTSAIDDAPPSASASRAALSLTWPATSTEVFATLAKVAARAAQPLGSPALGFHVTGPAALADLAPQLRPIGAAFVMSGFDASLAQSLGSALGPVAQQTNQAGASAAVRGRLRPGDPVGMSLVRGDFESGATGTVTHVAGNRVYAFGHPFLNLGSSTMAMTQARVVTVLPSLDSSMKIASLGEVIGTITQDRATAVGGTLGAGPKELEVNLTMRSPRAPARTFRFFVLNDPSLTPLFTYVSVLNSLVAYERQTGVLAISAKGTASFGRDGQVSFDDVFSGETALTAASAAIAAPIGTLMGNEFKTATAERLTVEVDVSESQRVTTIERAWLDTVRPELGGSYTLQVQLRDYRGDRRTVGIPITMPRQVDGPLTLLVADAPTLSGLEQRELKPARPASWTDLVAQANALPRNNRVYVRLIASAPGAAVGGDTLSSLPATVQSAIQADTTISRTSVTRTVVGSWDQRLDVAVRGSRELTVTLKPAR